MTYVERHRVSLTTDADGDVTGYTPVIRGAIVAVVYGKVDFADGVDFTITTERTGQGVWTESDVNAAKTVRPKALAQDLAGADLTAIYEQVHVADERIKIVVASGGDTKSGTFDVLVS